IQRYIEDPLADFVLRAQVPPGSTVLVEPNGPEDEGSEEDVKLSIIQPVPKPTPVGVGAEGGEASSDGGGEGAEPALPSEGE
ncbi:MAG TPA: hypothetical protein VG275_08515, partial [Solirubrobacteraceae bacterium]|nr:hypothetical protein [Solirubrobacteraceae bacterium]